MKTKTSSIILSSLYILFFALAGTGCSDMLGSLELLTKQEATPTWTWTVSFDSQSATTAATPVAKTIASPATTIGTLPAAPVKSSYTFAGWWTKANGEGTEFTSSTPVSGNLTVFAKWATNTYIVTFDSQGATTAANPATISVTSPSTTVETMPIAPIKTGYNFGGWWTEANGGGTQFTASTTLTGNITVFAKWTTKAVYTVSFESNRGSVVANQLIEEGSSIAPMTAPTKTGYAFGGWYADAGHATAWDFANMKISKVTTLYAKWDLYSYMVTFDSQSATTAASPTTIIVASPATTVGTLPAEPQKSGCTFGGWWTETNGGGTQFKATSTVIGNRIVYAKWIPGTAESNFTTTGSGIITDYTGTDNVVVIPATIGGIPVTGIGNRAFNGKSTLTSVTLPDTLTGIDQYAFCSCTNLGNLIIPNSVKSIGIAAFQSCSNLTSIRIPEGVTTIERDTFTGCSNLASVTLPSSLTAIGATSFTQCTSLKSINIPISVNTIGGAAFWNCSQLTTITIPDSVTSIADSTFAFCSSLTTITIPPLVTYIGLQAFWKCSKLTSITIPSKVTTIGSAAFRDCPLLTTVYINAINPPSLLANSFENHPGTFTIKVIASSLSKYQTNANWNIYSLTTQ